MPLQLPGTASPVASPLGGGDEVGFPFIPGELIGPLGRLSFDPLAALADLWNWLNRRDGGTLLPWTAYDVNNPLTSATVANWTWAVTRQWENHQNWCQNANYRYDYSDPLDFQSGATGTSVYFEHQDANVSASCPNNGGVPQVEGYLRAKVTNGGTTTTLNMANGSVSISAGNSGSAYHNSQIGNVKKDGQPLPQPMARPDRYPVERPFANPSPATLAPSPLPLPGPGPAPVREPETETQPQPQPGQPAPVPVLPDGTPGTTPGPLPFPFPGWNPGVTPAPSPIPNPLPRPNPGTVPIGPDGNPLPQPQPPPVVVPPTIEQIGDLVIGQPGTAPPPTLEGIAQEVGKIEQKTRYLIEKNQAGPPGGGIDELDDLLDLLTNIYNFLTSVYGPGEYQLAAPCEEGVVLSAEWSGGIGSLSLLGKKVDAIAELLQHHKNLRQPICRGSLQGTPVTVNFREI